MVEAFPHETHTSADPALVGPEANTVPYTILGALIKNINSKIRYKKKRSLSLLQVSGYASATLQNHATMNTHC